MCHQEVGSCGFAHQGAC